MGEPEVAFHPGAAADYEEAYAWYAARGATLALEFEREVERCLRLIVEAPRRWPAFDSQRRRIIVRRFPYSIVYEVTDAQIFVLAVVHGRRRPSYWRGRVTSPSPPGYLSPQSIQVGRGRGEGGVGKGGF